MPKPARRAQSSVNLAIININIRASSGSSNRDSQAHKLSSPSHSILSHRSSTTLTAGQQPHTPLLLPVLSPPAADDARQQVSMYRQALRTNHGTARPGSTTQAPTADGAGWPVAPPSAESAAVWLDVHYVQGEVHMQIAFPGGMAVGQARDLCMLRFGVWKELMAREGPTPAAGPAPRASVSSNHSAAASDDFKSARAQSMASAVTAYQSHRSSVGSSCGSEGEGSSSRRRSSGSSSSGSGPRSRYGLYWPAQARWLESRQLLSRYPLAPGDRVELQDRGAFIATPVGASASIGSDSCSMASSSRSVCAETQGWVYYLQAKGLSTAWRECWLELRSTALAGYKAARKTDKAGQPLARSARDKPLVAVDLSGGFRLVDQHGQQADAPLAMLAAMPRVSGVQGVPLIIRCNATRTVYVFCTRAPAESDRWQRALTLVQDSLGPTAASAAGSTATSIRSSIRSMRVSQPPAVASSLVHRPPQPPAMPAPVQQFAGIVRVRACGPQPANARAPAEALCVVIPRTLVGLARDYCGPMDPASTATAARFTIDLCHTRVQILQSGASFVFCVLRGAAPGDLHAEVVLAFDVDGADVCAQWSDALRTIGGIDTITAPCRPSPAATTTTKAAPAAANEDGAVLPALRRSRSCVSTLSPIDWPMPPSTLPPAPATFPVAFARSRGQTLVLEPLTLPPAAHHVGDPCPVVRRPSLDAVGIRTPLQLQPQPQPQPREQEPELGQLQQQRVSWFRRAVFRSGPAEL